MRKVYNQNSIVGTNIPRTDVNFVKVINRIHFYVNVAMILIYLK